MPRPTASLAALLITATLAAPAPAADSRGAAAWAAGLGSAYNVHAEVTYPTVGGIDLKLDVYVPRARSAPNPAVVYFHGGGWVGGWRQGAVMRLMPYFEMGFTVVNVSYRGGRVAPAPAAVEDCLCALRWVVNNAATYRLDPKRIVLSGDSAGSHLALTSGMLTAEAGLDRQCPGAATATAKPDALAVEPGAAAIVNWFGATDVGDLLEGPNAEGFAIAWFGSRPDRAELARRVSPLTWVRAGSPPVLTIHGDADSVVPIAQATRLHAELTRLRVRNRLITVEGKGHGDFTPERNEQNFAAIREFLGGLNLLPDAE